jgi:hypothetical protein
VKECSLISSVIILSFIRNIYLPLHSAFSFYHTAYKERINTVQQTLDVVEKLRNYRPKHPTPKSTRTPIFSGMGFSALSSKQHFNPFNGALRYPAHQLSTSREDSGSDADNDIKETGSSSRQMDLKNSKGAIFSWFGGPHGPPSREESDSSIETQEKMKSIDDDIELGPISSTTGNVIPSSQVHLNHQEYSAVTSITSPKPSLDNHSDTVFKQATKVLKNTVLHDARNLRSRTERLAGWDINSAHEAKVHSSSLIKSEENTFCTLPFSIWRARSISD